MLCPFWWSQTDGPLSLDDGCRNVTFRAIIIKAGMFVNIPVGEMGSSEASCYA